jgi:P-type conjugative transfer protein TrbG
MPYGGATPSETPLITTHRTTGQNDNATATPPPGATWAGETAADVRDANSTPRSSPPVPTPLSPNRPLTAKQANELSLVRRWRSHFVTPVLGPDGWMHLTYGDGEPSVVCAPLHICTIALQPGELVTAPPDVSDPRWIVHPRYTFEDGNKVVNVIMKPADAGLDGTIVISTNRRVYSINLVSRTGDYMPLVKFDYADGSSASGSSSTDWSAAAMAGDSRPADPCDSAPIVPPSSYRIDGPKQPWKPVQVWAVSSPVGEKTCVEFASDIGSKPLPALVALGNDGGWFSGPTPQIVNFRYVNRRFEIDEALDRFELISGVGSNQEKVEIQKVGQS